MNPDIDHSPEVCARVARRILPALALLYVFSSLDRANVGFAAPQMNADLGFDPAVYGFGVGIFFVGYLALQLPSVWLLKRIGARLWITGTVVLWGIIATLGVAIHDQGSFYLNRLLLGMAEAGFAPGMTYYISRWLPSAYRGRAMGFTMLSVPVSMMIGGPLSGALLSFHPLGLAGWRWMFLVEGLPPLLLGLFAFAWFQDEPDKATWLTQNQRQWIAAVLAKEDADARQGARSGSQLNWMLSRRVWTYALIWFTFTGGSYGLMYWLPETLHRSGIHSAQLIGLLTVAPWAGVAAGMILNGRHSDLTGERIWHLAGAALLGAVALLATIMTPIGWPALLLLSLSGLGMGGALGLFWSLPSRDFSHQGPNAFAVINMLGNTSGAVLPALIGLILARTGHIFLPVVLTSGLLALGGVMIAVAKVGGRPSAEPSRRPTSIQRASVAPEIEPAQPGG